MKKQEWVKMGFSPGIGLDLMAGAKSRAQDYFDQLLNNHVAYALIRMCRRKKESGEISPQQEADIRLVLKGDTRNPLYGTARSGAKRPHSGRLKVTRYIFSEIPENEYVCSSLSFHCFYQLLAITGISLFEVITEIGNYPCEDVKRAKEEQEYKEFCQKAFHEFDRLPKDIQDLYRVCDALPASARKLLLQSAKSFVDNDYFPENNPHFSDLQNFLFGKPDARVVLLHRRMIPYSIRYQVNASASILEPSSSKNLEREEQAVHSSYESNEENKANARCKTPVGAMLPSIFQKTIYVFLWSEPVSLRNQGIRFESNKVYI